MKFNNYFVLVLLFVITVLTGTTFQFFKQGETVPTFVLLTDFGYDFAVGSIKGVISSQIPKAHIIDLDHTIDKFNITSAGFVLAKSYHYFPKDTIFICVIDPGVGTKREPICIKTPSHAFIGPNNGLFDFILEKEKNCIVYQIDESYLNSGANTFHGRDLFAPAAVDFYKNNLYKFKQLDKSKIIYQKEKNQIVATYIDSFGNIKTNKEIDETFKVGNCISITINSQNYTIPFVKTFKDVNLGQSLCYSGSNNTIEIAVNQGSAAEVLNIKVGDTITFN